MYQRVVGQALRTDMTETLAVNNRDPETSDVVVWKFGGTSIGDPARLRTVAERIVEANRRGVKVVAVLSAMGQTTDRLVRLAGDYSAAPPPRELDALLCLGECLSCALAAMRIHELGGRAISLSGPQAGVITDGSHGAARLVEIRAERIREALEDGSVVLVAGFQGVSPAGDVTTLGRGGSDTSAVALAAGLGLRRCEIFTDVSGVFTADPRAVPDARVLTTVSHGEMVELAHAGAAVLAARSVELAQAHDIDIHIRSTFTAGGGTWVCKENLMLEETRITGVAHRPHEPLYAVSRASPATIVRALAARGVRVGLLLCDGEETRFTAPGGVGSEIVAAIKALGFSIHVRDDLGAVTLVGRGVGSRPEVAARALAALEQRGISAQVLTSTSTRLSCHVSSAAADEAARALHQAFGLDEGDLVASAREVGTASGARAAAVGY